MLTYEEKDELCSLLARAIRLSEPRAQLVVMLPDELQGKLNSSGTPDSLAVQAVNLCLKSGYALNPPALKRIVEHLIDTLGALALLTEIEARIAQGRLMVGTPFDAVVLGAPLVFINRTSLRAALRDMDAMDQAPSILVVDGGHQTGKSFLGYLVEHHCLHHPTDVFCSFKIESAAKATAAGPLQIARDFVTCLGGDPDALPPEDLASGSGGWNEELVAHVLKLANKAPSRVWFVIDGFRSDLAREDACEFLVAFANKIRQGVAAKRHRLILTDFASDRKGDLPIIGTRLYSHHLVDKADVEAAVTEIIATKATIPAAEKSAVAQQALAMVLADQTVPLESLKLTGERLQRLLAL